jgi:uncharacterized membrane protein HdeD (DUF308 family)
MSSNTIDTSLTTAATTTTDARRGLRDLYFARFGFAVIWAGLFALTASDLNAASVGLLLVYPLVDLAAAASDARSSGRTRARAPLHLNMALSLLTAVGLAVAATSGIPAVLRVWGVWAITAGLVQLVVAVRRRRLGGQVAMILSGGISTLAGTSFLLQAGGSNASLKALAGYAVLGGVFFLVSAIRLGRGAVEPR